MKNAADTDGQARFPANRPSLLEQPQSQGRPKWNVYSVKVEIDVSVAGQRSTYVFNCVHGGQATVIQPLGMR